MWLCCEQEKWQWSDTLELICVLLQCQVYRVELSQINWSGTHAGEVQSLMWQNEVMKGLSVCWLAIHIFHISSKPAAKTGQKVRVFGFSVPVRDTSHQVSWECGFSMLLIVEEFFLLLVPTSYTNIGIYTPITMDEIKIIFNAWKANFRYLEVLNMWKISISIIE